MVPGRIRLISLEEYTADLQEFRLVPIDCSCDSMDGKTKAAEVYKYQRIENALYFNMNQFFKKPKHLTPSVDEFKAAA